MNDQPTEEDPKQNYYAVIPAYVLMDNKLSVFAKLLYGQISALCNLKGFCWAENEYFCTFHDVSHATVKRALALLHKQGHLEIEIFNNNKRKIYLPQLKNERGVAQKRAGGSSKMSGGSLKNEPGMLNIIKNNIVMGGNSRKLRFLEHVLLTKEEHKTLIDKIGAKDLTEYLERLNNYVGSTGKRYKSHYFTILNWHRRDKKENQEEQPKRRLL